MKPIKQTFYTNVQNETISNDTFSIVKPSDKSFVQFVEKKEGYFFTPEQLNEYTANVIKDALNTAAEKAVTKDEWWGNTGSEYCDTVVDWQSITNTFEQIFKQFEV